MQSSKGTTYFDRYFIYNKNLKVRLIKI